MNNEKSGWVDRDALFIVSIVYLFLFLPVIVFFCAGLLKHNMEQIKLSALLLIIISIYPLTFSHFWPLKISRDKIFVAPPGFPSIGRKALPLNEIVRITYENPQRWDEKAGKGKIGHSFFGYIRIEDIHGKKYRNVLFRSSIYGFRQYIQKLINEDMVEKEFINKLSKILKIGNMGRAKKGQTT